jgi:hypothetical protein
VLTTFNQVKKEFGDNDKNKFSDWASIDAFKP